MKKKFNNLKKSKRSKKKIINQKPKKIQNIKKKNSNKCKNPLKNPKNTKNIKYCQEIMCFKKSEIWNLKKITPCFSILGIGVLTRALQSNPILRKIRKNFKKSLFFKKSENFENICLPKKKCYSVSFANWGQSSLIQPISESPKRDIHRSSSSSSSSSRSSSRTVLLLSNIGCHRCPCKDILTFLLRHQLGIY